MKIKLVVLYWNIAVEYLIFPSELSLEKSHRRDAIFFDVFIYCYVANGDDTETVCVISSTLIHYNKNPGKLMRRQID